MSITTKTIASSLHNRQQGFMVDYEYKGHSQLKLFGKSFTDDLLIVNDKKFGDKIKILVSPIKETQSCLLPRLEALKNNWQI